MRGTASNDVKLQEEGIPFFSSLSIYGPGIHVALLENPARYSAGIIHDVNLKRQERRGGPLNKINLINKLSANMCQMGYSAGK